MRQRLETLRLTERRQLCGSSLHLRRRSRWLPAGPYKLARHPATQCTPARAKSSKPTVPVSISTAAAAARRALAIAPGNIRARSLAAWNLILLGRSDEALRELQKTPADDYRRLVGEGIIAARAGRKADALGSIRAIGKRYGDAANYQYAEVYAQLDMTDEGIQALEVAWAKRDSGLGSIRVDPFLDPLRSDPRFSRIAARLFT